MIDRVRPSSKPNGKKTTTAIMIDTVYPSSKPNGNKTTTVTTPKPRLPPPPTKTKPHNSTNTTTATNNRHPHRPNPTTTNNQTRRRSRRGCLCLFCFWSILIIILLLLIATVTGCVLYLLYRPHRPTFSIAAIKIHEFNLTTTNDDDTTKLTSKINITISTRNPNKKIIFYYDPFAITCLSDEIVIAKGSFGHSLISNPNNISVIHSSLSYKSELMETQSVNSIKSNLKRKSGLPMKIFLDTEARVKIESIRTRKVGIRVKCEGIHSLIPKIGNGKSRNSSSYVTANVSGVKCKFDLRIKIGMWTF